MRLAPQKLSVKPVGHSHLLLAKLLIDTEPFAQGNDLWAGKPNHLEAVAVFSQSIGEHERVASVIFCTAGRVTVTEAVGLLGIDGIDGDASLQERIHNRAMRLFDSDGDSSGLSICTLQEPIRHMGQPFGRMFEATFAEILSACIQYMDLMKPRAQVHTNE